MHIKPLVFAVCFLSIICTGYSSAWAHDVDKAYRVGAFAGAMNYCGDRHEARQRRYRWAQLRAADEVSFMHRADRVRALVARNNVLARGQFFGTALNARSCNRLLRSSEWQRFFKP